MPLLCRCEERNFGVGARQQYNVTRGLGEIDCGRTIGDRSRRRRQQVHSTAPQHKGHGKAPPPPRARGPPPPPPPPRRGGGGGKGGAPPPRGGGGGGGARAGGVGG